MNLNKSLLILLFNLLVLVICREVNAEEHSKLTFSVAAPSSKPYLFKDGKGEPQGFLVEFFALIKQKTDIDINIIVLPWARGLNAVKFGQYDALMPTFYSKERAEFFVFPSESILDIYTVLLKRSEDDLSIKTIADIGSKKLIAKQRASSMGKVFDDAESSGEINVIEVRDLEHAIEMLVHSRVDLVATTEYVSAYELNRLDLHDKVKVIKVEDSKISSYLAFSKKHEVNTDVNEIMKRIKEVKGTPEYHDLVDKFLKSNGKKY